MRHLSLFKIMKSRTIELRAVNEATINSQVTFGHSYALGTANFRVYTYSHVPSVIFITSYFWYILFHLRTYSSQEYFTFFQRMQIKLLAVARLFPPR